MGLRFVLALLVLPFALAQEDPPSDEVVRAAWEALEHQDRIEIAQWFSAEAERLDTFQNALMAHVFAVHARARYDWPEAQPELPLYDPKKHAPAQVIPRRWLRENSSEVKRWKERVFAAVPERALLQGWRYDYPSASVVRLGDEFDPERVFHNGLAGLPPDLDLAEAIVESWLDDESLREVLTAFGHGYSDRNGKAYPGVTLYDVWCSGAQMEMPDVECLGIIHDVLDEWDRWVAPVDPRDHGELYQALGEIFAPARRHRGLRTALARTYLIGTPVMRDQYGPTTDRLHSLWDSCQSEPSKLIEQLPGSGEEWTEWFVALGQKVMKDPELMKAGQNRRLTLEADQARVRRVLVGVMTEYGAFKEKD